jgi:TrpR-related protein YerC/YecD
MKPNRQDSDTRQARAEDALFRAFVSLRNTTECGNFLRDLCTPAELQALVDRWQVVELLEQGLTYRKIHDLTGVSVTTIGRVARFLTDGFGGYQTAIARTDLSL